MALLVPCDALACVGCLKNRISELAISAVPLTFETFDPPAAAVYVRRLAKKGTGFNRILNRKGDRIGTPAWTDCTKTRLSDYRDSDARGARQYHLVIAQRGSRAGDGEAHPGAGG